MKPEPLGPVKLVVSVFTGEPRLFADVMGELESLWGAVDLASGPFDIETSYYEAEFGGGLRRKIFSFEKPFDSERLASLKSASNALEGRFIQDGGRRVNIDPGYLTLDKFVLLSCKNFSHRIYLGEGVYGDLQFIYRDGRYAELPWTYPDWKDPRVLLVLYNIRKRFAFQTGKGAQKVGK